jgi:hypothetical protein
MGACAPRCQLRCNDFVEQVLLDFDRKHFVSEFELANFLSV